MVPDLLNTSMRGALACAKFDAGAMESRPRPVTHPLIAKDCMNEDSFPTRPRIRVACGRIEWFFAIPRSRRPRMEHERIVAVADMTPLANRLSPCAKLPSLSSISKSPYPTHPQHRNSQRLDRLLVRDSTMLIPL